jgi:hypothetical protein
MFLLLLLTILILFLFLQFSDGNLSSSLISAAEPIRLHLTRLNSKSNQTSLVCKSKPSLFARALRIKSGKSFHFDFSAWRDIQKSGLFKNLTARSILKENEVILEIYGQELPSIKFAPKIKVTASPISPEVSGGVSLSF